MQSIRVTLFSGKLHRPIFISIPILNQTDLIKRVKDLATRHYPTRYLKEKNHVNCRELFQEDGKPEIFFFPSSPGECVSLQMMDFGEVFFLRHLSYGFIFCFSPNTKTRLLTKTKTVFFREKKGYPAGVTESVSFFFSPSHISILVSEHGCITANSDGELLLRGIEIALLQRIRSHGKSVFVQRKNEFVSPNRPLSEDLGTVNLFQMNKKYIKVRCICKAPEFCYSAQFPVLSAQELEQEILQDKKSRLQRYGDRSHLYLSGTLERCLLQEPNDKHMIMFPHGMGIDVPFGNVQGGRMFFSYYTDRIFPGCSLEKFKLTFFPPLFDQYENLQIVATRKVKDIFQKKRNTAFSLCTSKRATIFTASSIKLVSCSSSEYQLVGAKVEMISTKNHGGWGICFSCETINLANSPLPGPSGIVSREHTTQAAATVSVPPERQGQQTQQEGRSRPVPWPYGVRHHSYPYGPLPFYGGFYKSPIIPHPRVSATVSSASEREVQHIQQKGRSRPLSGSSGIGRREATASFSQSGATVAIPPESESPQTQQEGRNSPLSAPFGVRHQVIRPMPFCPQAASAASVSTERQSQQTSHTQQRRNSPVPGPSGVRYHPYFYPGTGSFVGGFYPYGSPYPHPFARQDQWMPVFTPSASVASLEPLRYNIPVQEGVGHSGRAKEASASVSVGVVQQTPIWRPDEKSSSAEVSQKAQAENPDEDTDIDVEN